MMELVEDGVVEAIIVKAHSRLGRNRLVIGQLLEEILEEHNVRYIAVTDNIDSLKGLDDMVAVRDLFNEWYARDTSKKIRAVWRAKSSAGKRLCNNPPTVTEKTRRTRNAGWWTRKPQRWCGKFSIFVSLGLGRCRLRSI